MINDVSGLADPEMSTVILEFSTPICIMHMQGTPTSMQQRVGYTDVVSEVQQFLNNNIQTLLERGHPINLICVDPGIGFGKHLEHNIALLQTALLMEHKEEISTLWGVSRKTMIGELTGQDDPALRLAGTLAVASYACQRGIDILRVHDVREHVDFFNVLQALL